ncbi:hypothetical protein [Enterobacter phage vB_ExiM_F5M1E]|nr:hypothetical protein OMEGA_279 [Klebsiella phage vB_KaeM_KaOmega]UNA02889.1 hypothetical protein [Enterobacter phage vB_ExiM_F1M1E]UNA03210.1 hypothetical protein [Enterobacter phage vB_ExiM_F2M1E]UNA03530.1 hypothetical protein [Enterobacter phage vB_ExiM_F4M1E]UNA03851.1 hypothetical protein [Enterobacter phage vB_ExiM_F5M1E]UNA04171.1 hypothetical protein [Pantoea phage vB_PdiM_F5M2A]
MCDCESCKLGRRVTALRDYLVDQGQEDHLETINDLYSEHVHDGLDHDWLKAVVDNNWPSAEAYMKSKGWVREQKEQTGQSNPEAAATS